MADLLRMMPDAQMQARSTKDSPHADFQSPVRSPAWKAERNLLEFEVGTHIASRRLPVIYLYRVLMMMTK